MSEINSIVKVVVLLLSMHLNWFSFIILMVINLELETNETYLCSVEYFGVLIAPPLSPLYMAR